MSMKKIFTYILVASSALLLASCTKEFAKEIGNTQEGELLTFYVKAPEYTVKTTLGTETGHKSVTWDEGDSVKVVYGTTAATSSLARIDTNGVINIRVAPGTVTAFYATYPHTVASSLKAAAGPYVVTIPAEQDGDFASANIMAAFANADRVFRFYNACSLIGFKVDDPQIEKVVIRANDGTPIAGPAELTFDKDSCDITAINYGTSCTKEITVNCDGTGIYYAALLPGVNLGAGLGFRFIKGGQPMAGVLSRTPVELKASELLEIGNIESRIGVKGDLYVKANGAGTGASWNDAAGPSTLYKMLSSRSGETLFDGVTTSWKLNGRNIYLAEGTYDFKDTLGLALAVASGKLLIQGGFPESAIGKDLSGYDPAKCPTVITAGDKIRVLNICGGDADGVIEFKGLTFSGANIEGNGGGILIETPDSLTFEDCTISSNTVTGHGGGIAAFGGKLYFKNCTLTLNKATTTVPASTSETQASLNASHGGALYLDGPVKCYINKCKFSNNASFVSADLEVRRGADAYIYSTSFIGAVAQAGSYFSVYPGRSINADAMYTTDGGAVGCLAMYNCTVTKTSSAYSSSGGLPQVAPTNYRALVASCTLHDPAVANLRNNNHSSRPTVADQADLIWLINTQLINSNGNGINLAASSNQHGFYNLLEKGKNSYETLAETDTSIKESDYSPIEFYPDDNCYKWTLSLAYQKITRTIMSDLISTKFPGFHAWLQTLNDNPYGLDQLGTTRNPGAFYPGAWDAGM